MGGTHDYDNVSEGTYRFLKPTHHFFFAKFSSTLVEILHGRTSMIDTGPIIGIML